jgi:alkanesulfonate monooxygenase SsuD/methylene tetrahydromethanopterin reductase-like flavin-dependent oxidoreductase (luciferase family)
MFADRPWPARLPGIERYRELFAQYNGATAPPVVTADQCICAATSAEANELAERHMACFVDSNLEHYELMSTHFTTAKGYDAYAKKSEIARTTGRDGLVNALLQVAVRGTPDEVLRAYDARRDLLGEYELNSSFRFGGIPFAKAEASMRLFAKEVMPVLKSWQTETGEVPSPDIARAHA